jgi:FAD-dependent oxidoreductase domain-containing protein 1
MGEIDALIVGAGILGLSTAYHIKQTNPNAKVRVIEKFSSSGQGNTAKSAAAFRCIFSSSTNYTLADSSVEFYRHLQEDLGVELGLQWLGYLWLLDERGYGETVRVFKKLKRILNLEYTEYDETDLAQKLQVQTDLTKDEESRIIGLKSIFGGILIPKAGVINDVDCLVKFYENEFLRLNGKIEYGVKAESLISEPEKTLGIQGEPYFWQRARVAGVKTNMGRIRAKKTILVAGAWMPTLLDAIGIECYIKPKKRQFFTLPASNSGLKKLLSSKGFNSHGSMPFTILPNIRIYIRPFPREQSYWIGYADEFPRAFALEENPQPEKNFYELGIYQVLTRYFPQFKDVRTTSASAGLYEVNTLDGHPVIFEENDLIAVGGASGSGITKADSIGRISAALYNGEKYANFYGERKFKVSDLGIQRRMTEPEELVL